MTPRPRAATPSVQICTIAARNYLSRVRVLAASLAEHGTTPPLRLFLVDDPEGQTPDAGEHFTVLPLSALPLDPEVFAQMTIYYSLTELATAVKPSVLAALLSGSAAGRGSTGESGGAAEVAVYLDPDTELLAPLEDLWAICHDEQSLVLTPHALQPYPRDGLSVDESTLTLSGVFNLGFIAVPRGPVADEFLPWWAERLRTEALVAPEAGLFTDQRWMDLAPSLFPCHIVRDPGVNVAYWNLHERPIRREEGVWLAGGAPLRLFHYSGFDADQPGLVSRYQHAAPRAVRSDNPDLGALLDLYAQRIRDDEPPDGDAVGPMPYRWGSLPNGLPLTDMIRRLYWSELRDHEQGTPGLHPRPPSPGEADWVARFDDWLCEPVPPSSFPRLVDTLFRHRPDVAASFTGVAPRSTARNLGRWLSTWGVQGYGITPSLAVQLWRQLDEWAAAAEFDEADHRDGGQLPPHTPIDVLGLTGARGGLASAARQLQSLLERCGFATRPVSIAHTDPRIPTEGVADVTVFGDNPDHRAAAVTVMCLNADLVEAMGPRGRRQLLGEGRRVGYWWWEVDRLPEAALPALQRVDEIWAGSTFVAEQFRALTDTPVFRVPLPLRQPRPGSFDAAAFGAPGHERLFSFIFDYSSNLARKNPLGLIEAYCEAFSPGDGSVLVIKSINGPTHDRGVELVRHAAALRPDICLIEQYLDTSELDAMLAASAAFVSLHRAEGLGLSIADACQLGVPVIASAYGGCMDFLAADSSLLVPVSLHPVGAGNDPYPGDAVWAEPDLGVAVGHLRTVAEDPDACRAMADLARRRVEDTYHEDMCRAIAVHRLAELGLPLPEVAEP